MKEKFRKSSLVNMFFNLVAAGIVAVLALAAFGVYAAKIASGLPDTDLVRNMAPSRSVPIDQSEIPPFFMKAVISSCDPGFLGHKGVDAERLKSSVAGIFNGTGGGVPTVTQRVARMALGTDGAPLPVNFTERMTAGLRELMLATKIEMKIKSKHKIFEIYCNNERFGAGVEGLFEASSVYFGKRPMELSEVECALMCHAAGNPGVDIYTDPKAAREGVSKVLDSMFRAGFITASDLESLRAQKIRLQPFIGSGRTEIASRVIEL